MFGWVLGLPLGNYENEKVRAEQGRYCGKKLDSIEHTLQE